MRAMLIDKDPASLARYAALPSLLQCSACSMWLAYSVCVLKSDALLANNVIGTAVSLLYALAFVLKRPTLLGKAVVAAAWLLAIAATLLIYGLLYFSPSQGPGSDATASGLTVAITCVLWASPLAALYSALTDLDDKRVPLPLTLSMLATVAIWLVVGVLVGDISLVVSSAVGVFFTLLQVAVYGACGGRVTGMLPICADHFSRTVTRTRARAHTH